MSHLKLVSPPKKAVDALEGLRQNLQKLQELHDRLRVMLKELETLEEAREK